MKCSILFSGKNKKNISKCRLLKILPRVLSVKSKGEIVKYFFGSKSRYDCQLAIATIQYNEPVMKIQHNLFITLLLGSIA